MASRNARIVDILEYTEMSAKSTMDAALTTQSRVCLGASEAVIFHPHRY